MPPVEDQRSADAIVAALQRGDDGAFEVLVRTHGGRMFAVIRRVVGNDDDAREALQDALFAAHRAIASFAGGSQLSTWLHKIALNSALMKLRHRRCRPENSLDDLLPRFQEDGHHLEPPCPFGDHADAQAQTSETRVLVRAAVDSLPPTYREIVVLRDLEGLSTEAAAELLGITSNAVKIRLHRARQALRTLLERHFVEAAP